jgi:phosphohistidine phosphatase
MALTLWLLRHFSAVEDPPAGGRDRDRRLSPRGLRSAERLSEALRDESVPGPIPTVSLVSPALRTQQSAARAFGDLVAPPRQLTDARLYHATPDDVLEILRELPDDDEVVCVVGHNPTMHCLSLDLVSELTLDGAHPALNAYPPGMLSVISLPIESWSKVAFGEGTLRTLR